MCNRRSTLYISLLQAHAVNREKDPAAVRVFFNDNFDAITKKPFTKEELLRMFSTEAAIQEFLYEESGLYVALIADKYFLT